MKKYIPIILSVILYFSLSAEVKTYKYVDGIKFDASLHYKVKADKKSTATYRTPCGDICAFEMSGKTELLVKTSFDIKNVTIRPISKKIKYSFDKREISITLNKPENFVVEVNDDSRNPLYIFANKPETDKPSKDAPNVLYFEAGKRYYLDKMVKIKSNQTLYIEGGAIVFGGFYAHNAENVKVRGAGIISNQYFVSDIQRVENTPKIQPLRFRNCKNIDVQGIIITESANWSAPMFYCEDVVYRDLKIVSDRGCDDGIDVVSSKNVLIENCFIRTRDDCIAIKCHDNGNSENIKVSNCTFWNSFWGNAIEIGFETRSEFIKNIIFDRNIILRCQNGTFHKSSSGTVTIHNGDRAHVQNVLFRNLIIEEPELNLFDMEILHSPYSKDKQRGKISNVIYENVYVYSKSKAPLYCRFLGFDEKSDIQNITFKNIVINGKKVVTEEDLNLTKKFTTNIKFK